MVPVGWAMRRQCITTCVEMTIQGIQKLKLGYSHLHLQAPLNTARVIKLVDIIFCTYSIQLLVLGVLSLLWFIPIGFFNRFNLNFIINAVWSIKLIQVLRYTRYSL